jgi:hypothetical protein
MGQRMRFSGIGLWRRVVHQSMVMNSSRKTICDGSQIGSFSIIWELALAVGRVFSILQLFGAALRVHFFLVTSAILLDVLWARRKIVVR